MTPKNRLVPFLMMAGGILLIAVAALALMWMRPPATAGPRQLATQAFGAYPEILRVTLPSAKAAYEAKEAIFVDVRGDEYYQSGHIPGALSIPGYDLANRLGELDPAAWIIPYCT